MNIREPGSVNVGVSNRACLRNARHMGNRRVTVQVGDARVDVENNLIIMIRGAVPGRDRQFSCS